MLSVVSINFDDYMKRCLHVQCPIQVRKHFSKFIHERLAESEMWYESWGTPLKWHHPIGVIFDSLKTEETVLPWQITVHFDRFPQADLLPCPSREAVESHFMSCIKVSAKSGRR